MRLKLHGRRLHPRHEAWSCGQTRGEDCVCSRSLSRREKRNFRSLPSLSKGAAKQVILLTTSRRPTRTTRTLCHDLVHSVPNIVRLNRGKLNLDGIAERAIELNANRIIVIDGWKTGLGKIKLFLLEQTDLTQVPPLMYVASVRLRREFETKTKRIRSLAVTVEPQNHTETIKIAEHLADFFNLPRLSIGEAATKRQASMNISLDASRRTQITFVLPPQMVEIGPRITLSKVLWEVSL